MILFNAIIQVSAKLSRKFDTVDITKDCEKDLFRFKLEYKKNYTLQQEEAALDIFCKNLEYLKVLRVQNNATEYGLNAYFDMQSMPLSNIPHNFMMRKQSSKSNNQVHKLNFGVNFPDSSYTNDTQSISNYNRGLQIPLICSSASSPGDSSNVIDDSFFDSIYPASPPNSIDLREWGITHRAIDQGTCGSCWAQSARYVFTASVVRDLPFYKQLYPVSFQNATNSNLLLSVQAFMNGSFGSNKFCAGGNFISAAVDAAYQHFGLDFEKQIPYVSMMSRDEELLLEPTPIEVKTDEFKQNPLNPVHWFNPEGSCPKVLVHVSAENETAGFSSEDVLKIKRILSLGVPLSGHMVVDNSISGLAFSMYKGGIAHGKCEMYGSNHQVTLVGYGHYKTVPVWLFLNSWGSSWGQSGYYMIQQGENAFCSEAEVVGIVPRFFGYIENAPEIFNESSTYQNNKYMFQNSMYIKVRRGANGMDNYDVNNQPIEEYRKLPATKWLLVVVLICISGLFIFSLIKCVFYVPVKKIPMPMYIQYTNEEADRYDWTKAAAVEKQKQMKYDLMPAMDCQGTNEYKNLPMKFDIKK
ncbi:Papain_family cysteine protease [Hexamita inflata]|uniref:Papain family cysteine protease n=1 Tax=Hexamita inflata TaxID=28002 RepID=A0AA86Q7P6_9EUKA|nr:Papain family cysteine protease [Hexamita inflata]